VFNNDNVNRGYGMCSMVTNDRRLLIYGGSSNMKFLLNCKDWDDVKIN